MELSENADITKLLTALGKGIKKHGLKKIINAMQKIDLVNVNLNHLDIIDFIETSVCEKYNVLRAELYKENRRGDVVIARKLCILLLRKHLDMTDIEIGNHYGRTRQTLHHVNGEFRKLNKNNKVDATFLNHYNEFDTKIQDYISRIKQKTEQND